MFTTPSRRTAGGRAAALLVPLMALPVLAGCATTDEVVPVAATSDRDRAATAAPSAAPTGAPTDAPTPALTDAATAAPTPVPTVTTEVVREVEVPGEPDWAAVYRDHEASVVQVTSTECFTSGAATGTAFFVGPDLLATAAHVVDLASRSTVELEGKHVETELVGMDRGMDLALLRLVDGSYPDRVLELSREFPAVGTETAVIGFPSRVPETGKSVQTGVISAVGVDHPLADGTTLKGMVQSDVQTESGASGAPYLDRDGLVVGIDDRYAGPTLKVSLALGTPSAAEKIDEWVEDGRTRYWFC